MTSSESEYCLRWKKYEATFRSFFTDLYQSDTLVDMSLVTEEGHIMGVHRFVLSACSTYFQNIFKAIPANHPHPVIVLKDVSQIDLLAILSFMYKGYVNVPQHRVNEIMAIAASLQVKGLSTTMNYSPNTDDHTPSNASSSGKDVTVPSVNVPPGSKQLVPVQEKSVRGSATDRIPSVRPPLETQRGYKRKHVTTPSPFTQSNSQDSGKESPDFYGKPPVLIAQAKFSGAQTVDIKLEDMASPFKDDEDQMSDPEFLDSSHDEDAGNDTPNQDFLANSKALDELESIDFVVDPDADYSEALEFVQQEGQFLGEGSSAAGQHFMTGANAGTESKPAAKRKSGGSESRRFKCNTCGNQYNKYSHLNRHLQTHADPRFQCDKCLKLFVRKDVLRRHLIEVHNVVVANCKVK